MTLGAWGCATTGHRPPIEGLTPVPTVADNVLSLDQGWDAKEQGWFWFTSQGSEIVPYDWFLVLESAKDTSLFRADANMERFRYIPMRPTQDNPDGLPIGFVEAYDPFAGQNWMGLTCAACHTTQVNYKGTGLLIDGGPTMADLTLFYDELIDSLRATHEDDGKFKRFAQKVLGSDYTEGRASNLRGALLNQLMKMQQRRDLLASDHRYGFARLDAFGAILNVVTVENLNLPDNKVMANAPVSYPFLWDTSHSDLVQWNGSAPNAGIGSLLRNVGEMYGVFANVRVDPKRFPPGYPSSIEIENLGKLEAWLKDLQSPLWPEGILTSIDSEKASRGQGHYQQYCASCHAVINRADPKRVIQVVMTPLEEVGTDSTMALNFIKRQAKTGPLEGVPQMLVTGPKLGATASGLDVLVNQVAGAIIAEPIESFKAGLRSYENVPKAQQNLRAYKARPLNGIWATAPYLHNGSVPNLRQLLLPAAQRVKQFHVGSREFDPVNVGFETQEGPGMFLFDTTVVGNSNAGHEYGVKELNEAQREELLQYLKTL
jgi:hypothetical protein